MLKDINISIVGFGNIGEWLLSKICFEILNKNLHVSKIICIEPNLNRLKSKISDLIQSLLILESQYDKISICQIIDNLYFTTSFEQVKDCDYLITAYSAPIDKSIKNRSDLLFSNDLITQEIAFQLSKFIPPHCRIINIANPLDIVTWRLQYLTNLPVEQVVGISSQIDIARLAQGINEISGFNYLSIDLSSLNILGEHGPSAVPIFTQIKINQRNIFELLDNEIIEKIKNYSIQKGTQMMEANQCIPPHIAVAQATVNCLKSWVSKCPTKMTLCCWNQVYHTYLGTEVYISEAGISPTNLLSDLSQEEEMALNFSAKTIKNEYLKLKERELTKVTLCI
ncbi:MAG: hypothetical protein H0U70_00600 [Tatlockia sp.]|nr:hypothetical protein [Tatlockia sp.]MBA3978037.1 hypothetical protein [Nitrosopumilus sp.]